MRTHFASIFVLAIASLAGCGAVDDGICPGEQNDNVACTVDVCNADGMAWSHIPDNTLCGAGMRCDPTAGCVASGGLTGRALLFGHTNHSGITVTIDGVEGATATTAADGSWTISGIPPGTYGITYSKATWITEKQPGVGVLAEAATSPPMIELRRGREGNVGANGYAPLGQTYLTPDKKHGVVQYYDIFIGGRTYFAYNLETPGQPVTLIERDIFGQFNPAYLANTHLLYHSVSGDTIWSRPLDGGPPVVLGSAVPGGVPNETISIEGIGGAYAILRKTRYTGVYTEHTLWVVKVDGSQVMAGSTPAITTPDANHSYNGVVMNDTTAVVLLSNTSATPPTDGVTTMRRIDLATGQVTNINTGFAANQAYSLSVSPDRSYMMGYFVGSAWDRAFIMPVSGTAAPTLAPDYGVPIGFRYSDIPTSSVFWYADNSGLVYSTQSYSLSAGGTAEGHLKVWLTAQNQSTTLVTASAGYANWVVHNKSVVYRDNINAYSPLRVVSAHSTSPVSYPLDVDNVDVDIQAFNDDATTTSYLVWTQDTGQNSATRAKIYAANIPQPLQVAPQKTQLGGVLAPTCQYEAVLSDYTYWQLCRDTGVLSGFPQSTATPGTTTTMVRSGLIALPEADRVAFRRYDGKLYSSPNTGALTDVKLISATWDPSFALKASEKWIIFADSTNEYLRASNADGSAIDEPLSSCSFDYHWTNSGDRNWLRSGSKSTLLFSNLNCDSKLGDFWIQSANLP